MSRKLLMAVVLHLALICTTGFASPTPVICSPPATPESTKCVPASNVQNQSVTDIVAPSVKSDYLPASSAHPKVVFQINQAADASTILRFVANYLIAEPTAEVAVVGYAGGVDFMLKGAKDA